jgi:hypothetical protein
VVDVGVEVVLGAAAVVDVCAGALVVLVDVTGVVELGAVFKIVVSAEEVVPRVSGGDVVELLEVDEFSVMATPAAVVAGSRAAVEAVGATIAEEVAGVSTGFVVPAPPLPVDPQTPSAGDGDPNPRSGTDTAGSEVESATVSAASSSMNGRGPLATITGSGDTEATSNPAATRPTMIRAVGAISKRVKRKRRAIREHRPTCEGS